MSTLSIDPTWDLASFAASLRYDDLPAKVIEMVKRLVLDTLGAEVSSIVVSDLSNDTFFA